MKPAAALLLAAGLVLAACAPYPVYTAQVPTPLVAPRPLSRECLMIRDEIARQQRIAALSPVMETLLVEGAVRLNTYNVITGLEQRAVIEGCPIVYGANGVYGWNARPSGSDYRV